MALDTRFCSTRRKSLRSVSTVSPQGITLRPRFFSRGGRRKFERQGLQHLVDAEGRHIRLHGAGIEARDIEQRGENVLHRLERGIDIADQVAFLGPPRALHQAGREEPRRIERLQDVMACRGDELGLDVVGGIGFRLRDRQLLVEAGQFGGALGDAALQRLVGALQGIGGLARFPSRR